MGMIYIYIYIYEKAITQREKMEDEPFSTVNNS